MDHECGYCGQSLARVSSIQYAYKQQFHSEDCYPRARYIIEGTAFVECRECGSADGLNWLAATRCRLEEQQLCFKCSFWQEYADRANEPDVVRVEGKHYVVAPEQATLMSRGYGGRKFRIAFKDGRVIDTTNLWSQGEIPERWQSRLPNNAEFVKENSNAMA